jgi:hypothetical protein
MYPDYLTNEGGSDVLSGDDLRDSSLSANLSDLEPEPAPVTHGPS